MASLAERETLVDYLLSRALEKAQPGARNDTGFWLACQLRDNRIPEAEARQVMMEYVRRVPGGGRDYTEQEALASLRQAYRTPARTPLRAGQGRERSFSPHTIVATVTPPPVPRPPGKTWQEAGWAFVFWAQARLWGDEGREALDYLRARGLEDETIRCALIGWNPRGMRRPAERWGLAGRPIWLPRGYVIPWAEMRRDRGDLLWGINIRRPAEDIEARGGGKYVHVRGSEKRFYLYHRDLLRPGKPAVMVEGELDALTIAQAAGDIITPLAVGGSGGREDVAGIARLAQCPVVLLAFDADEAGENKAREWAERLGSRAHRWKPYWEDVNAMAREGADVRAWLVAGLRCYGWDPARTDSMGESGK